jgi:YggT family protein
MLLVLIVDLVFRVLYLLLVAYAVMSWLVPYPRKAWQRLIASIVEPLLHPVRALIPPAGGMDFSPIIVGFVLYLLQSLLVRSLIH